MFQWIKDWWNGKNASSEGEKGASRSYNFRSRYDAAITDDEIKNHLRNADDLSAKSANSASVRYKLRRFSRMEAANNSYYRGMIRTIANDLIGTGPRLQLNTDDNDLNSMVEADFAAWALAADFSAKLRTAIHAKKIDGEGIGLIVNNDSLKNDVKVDIRLIESEQMTTPSLGIQTGREVDGIRFDEQGNPVSYSILRRHPGDTITSGVGVSPAAMNWQTDDWEPEYVLHLFAAERPGQARGVPEATSSLRLFAMLRDYTTSVVRAANAASDFAIVIKTQNAPTPEPGSADSNKDAMDKVYLERGMATFLPDNYDIGQVDAKQPTTTYSEFKKEILSEIARCLQVPFNIASGETSSNFSSGRLDQGMYFKNLMVERSDIERVWCNKTYGHWLTEYVLVNRKLTQRQVKTLLSTQPGWFWDGSIYQDPAKEAEAADILVSAGLMTDAEWFAKRGQDWEEQYIQLGKEAEARKKYGLPDRNPVKPKLSNKGANEPDFTQPTNRLNGRSHHAA
jgi:lambda family phage portal protein